MNSIEAVQTRRGVKRKKGGNLEVGGAVSQPTTSPTCSIMLRSSGPIAASGMARLHSSGRHQAESRWSESDDDFVLG